MRKIKTPPCKIIETLDSGEMFACRIRNPRPWNPEFSSKNPESHQLLESGISVPQTRNPESSSGNPQTTATAWNPEFKTVFYLAERQTLVVKPDRRDDFLFIWLQLLRFNSTWVHLLHTIFNNPLFFSCNILRTQENLQDKQRNIFVDLTLPRGEKWLR